MELMITLNSLGREFLVIWAKLKSKNLKNGTTPKVLFKQLIKLITKIGQTIWTQIINGQLTKDQFIKKLRRDWHHRDSLLSRIHYCQTPMQLIKIHVRPITNRPNLCLKCSIQNEVFGIKTEFLKWFVCIDIVIL